MCLAAMTASAQTAGQNSDSLYIQKSYSQEQMLMPVNPTLATANCQISPVKH